jgi:hypothetical protein
MGNKTTKPKPINTSHVPIKPIITSYVEQKVEIDPIIYGLLDKANNIEFINGIILQYSVKKITVTGFCLFNKILKQEHSYRNLHISEAAKIWQDLPTYMKDSWKEMANSINKNVPKAKPRFCQCGSKRPIHLCDCNYSNVPKVTSSSAKKSLPANKSQPPTRIHNKPTTYEESHFIYQEPSAPANLYNEPISHCGPPLYPHGYHMPHSHHEQHHPHHHEQHHPHHHEQHHPHHHEPLVHYEPPVHEPPMYYETPTYDPPAYCEN